MYFKRIWGIETNNEVLFDIFIKILDIPLFVKKNLRLFLQEQRIRSYLELSNFKETNWKEWMNHFHRYNLSRKMCKWRFKSVNVGKNMKYLVPEENENLTTVESDIG